MLQNYWHYSRSWPWWQQRAFLVPAGIAFIVAANMMEEPGIKTTLMVGLGWWRGREEWQGTVCVGLAYAGRDLEGRLAPLDHGCGLHCICSYA